MLDSRPKCRAHFALVCHLTAASKSPASACAAARVSTWDPFFHSVNSQAVVPDSTASLPFRNLSSVQVALIQARLLWAQLFFGSSRTVST